MCWYCTCWLACCIGVYYQPRGLYVHRLHHQVVILSRTRLYQKRFNPSRECDAHRHGNTIAPILLLTYQRDHQLSGTAYMPSHRVSISTGMMISEINTQNTLRNTEPMCARWNHRTHFDGEACTFCSHIRLYRPLNLTISKTRFSASIYMGMQYITFVVVSFEWIKESKSKCVLE